MAVAQAGGRLGHLGQALRYFVEAARKDSHAAGRVMNLHARAVDLVLDGDTRAEHREGVGDRARRLREHRAQRARMRDGLGGGGRERARRRTAIGADGFAVRSAGACRPGPGARAGAARGDVGRLAQGLRQPPNVALQHVHPAHFIHRTPAHLRQRLEHQAFAHPVAHLADQHLGRVFRLKRRHPREKRAQPFELAFARAASFDVGYFFEAATDLGERERRWGLRRAASASASRSPRRSRLRR